MYKPKLALDLLLITLGSAVYGLGVALFLNPNHIAPGGLTGISMMLCTVLPGISLGTLILLLNIPLLLIALRKLGRRLVALTAYGTLVSSLMIDLWGVLLPAFHTEPLLAALYGGLLDGLGLGLIFSRGGTTGGSDVVARLLQMVFKNTKIGRLLLGFDGLVVAASGVVFGAVNNVLFGLITLFVSAQMVDQFLYGLSTERVAYIITSKPEEMARVIGVEMTRGATLLHGEGGYTGEARKLVLCAVKRNQPAALKELVRRVDPGAFLILTTANEVLGEGFSRDGFGQTN